MALAPGTRLGPYEIVGAIGAGGMGEVYRARDPRLGRDVAIKVLPTAFSADPDRLRRFEQEARAAAALNHPGILAVHDIGADAGAPYIVAELLEGETLRDRLNRGSTPGPASDQGLAVRKAIEYGIQLARGLSAAHEKGIVHRDLKPENVFITTDGRVKILDFGLAKLTEAAATADAGSRPTAPVETQQGTILGTMGYMSPEQVRGQPSDHRADIFAFGAILYEMLSGQRAFRGATAADTISAILDKDPADLPIVERRIPPALGRVVDRCLEKSPAARFQSTHDLAFALEGVSVHSDSGAIAGVGSTAKRNRRGQLPWALAGVLTVAVVAAGVLRFVRAPAEAQPAVRFSLRAPEGAAFSTGGSGSMAVSPDGRRIVFGATPTGGGPQMLWVRSLDSLDIRMLAGTEHNGPSGAFWSPDGRFVGFFADSKLKKIDISGGAPQTLCAASINNSGGTWGADGVIVFSTITTGLSRVSAAGGQPTPATTLDRGRQETSHRHPTFLPDGRRFTYLAQPGNIIYVGSLDSSQPSRLLAADSGAIYSAGHLLFVRQATLFAQPFDPRRATLSAEALPIAEQISSNTAVAGAAFTASPNGVLVYATGGGAAIVNQLTWFDRSGKSMGSIGSPADYRGIELSPDERRLAEHPHELSGGGDIWMRDLLRDTTTRLTFGAHNTGPVWSPDGTRIAYGANPPPKGQQPSADGFAGVFNLYEKRADGTGDPILLLDSVASKLPTGWKQPTSWSPDGKLVVADMIDPRTSWDIWAVPLGGDRQPRPLLHSEFQELEGQISPDGRWLAYTSNETRRLEVYVRPLSESAGKWQISTTGGSYPRWRRDGKELFYLSRDRKLTAVSINAGPAIEAGIPHALFDVRLAAVFISGNGFGGSANSPYPYVVTRDGQRFLVSVDTSQQAAEVPITVVVNWAWGLKH